MNWVSRKYSHAVALTRFKGTFSASFKPFCPNLSLGGFEPSTLGVGNLCSHPLSYKLKFFSPDELTGYRNPT